MNSVLIAVAGPIVLVGKERAVHVDLTLQEEQVDEFVIEELLLEIDVAADHAIGEGQLFEGAELGEDTFGQTAIETFAAPYAQRLNVGPDLRYLHPFTLFGSHVAAGDVQVGVAALGLEQPRHAAQTHVAFELFEFGQEVGLLLLALVQQRRTFQNRQRFQVGAAGQFQRVDVVDALVAQFHQIAAEGVQNRRSVGAGHIIERYFLYLLSSKILIYYQVDIFMIYYFKIIIKILVFQVKIVGLGQDLSIFWVFCPIFALILNIFAPIPPID